LSFARFSANFRPVRKVQNQQQQVVVVVVVVVVVPPLVVVVVVVVVVHGGLRPPITESSNWSSRLSIKLSDSGTDMLQIDISLIVMLDMFNLLFIDID
jgi:hypothetical protein